MSKKMQIIAAHSAKKNTAFLFGGRQIGAALCGIVLLFISAPMAVAEDGTNAGATHRVAALPPSGQTTLPRLVSIDANTNVIPFLQIGVPDELRQAALRRAWSVDPMIRDFRGLQENGWNFENPSAIPGFGDLGPEFDATYMLANLFSEPWRSPSRRAMRVTELFSFLFAPAQSRARE